MNRQVDFNCDLGEAFGAWRMGDDAAILPFISSANLACGFHAGDPETIRASVALCLAHRVAIGAHPSLPDLQGFGRRPMQVTPPEAYSLTLYQLGALEAFVRAAGARLHHVKPHGALYNQAAVHRELADAIVLAVRDFDPALILYGLSNSMLTAAGEKAGLRVAHEVFAERRYEADGTLTPRSRADAVIHDLEGAIAQATSLLTLGRCTSRTGQSVALAADTVCLHGDRPDAAAFAHALRRAIEDAGCEVRAPRVTDA